MDLIYFEGQRQKMCAQHALNMLLQGQFFTEESLVLIAQELDNKERAVLNPHDESHFMSHNYDETGYFSIQVIMEALRRQSALTITPLENPTVIKIRDDPSLAKAYICNMEDHWFAVRKIGGGWFILDSLCKSPKLISQIHMSSYITQLCKEGYSVYVVEGDLPKCGADALPNDFWIDRAATKKFESDIEKAIQLSLINSAKTSQDFGNDELGRYTPSSTSLATDDFDVQKALEASLEEVQQNFDDDTVDALLLNEAIQKSLYEAETSSSSLYASSSVTTFKKNHDSQSSK